MAILIIVPNHDYIIAATFCRDFVGEKIKISNRYCGWLRNPAPP
jgi:hypothetical protein